MTRISYVSTSFYKWVLPPLVVLTLLVCSASAAVVGIVQGRWDELQGLCYGAIAAAVAVVLVWRFYLYPLCDEVWDAGDELVVRNAGVEMRLPLANIRSVRRNMGLRLERMTLELDQPSELGDVIRFLLPYRYWRLGKPKILVELVERCAAARAAQGAAES